MAENVVEKESVREYNNKSIDRQKNNSKFDENRNTKKQKNKKGNSNNNFDEGKLKSLNKQIDYLICLMNKMVECLIIMI